MPGTLTIKPIQADLHYNKDLFKKMDPYCEFLVGGQKFRTSVCHRGGKHPHWNDTFTARINNESNIHIRLLDKDTFKSDDYIGMCEIDLKNISPHVKSSQWYPIYCKQSSIGEILLEISYVPQVQQPNPTFIGQPIQPVPVYQGVQPQIAMHNPIYPTEQMPMTRQATQSIVVYNYPAYQQTPQPMPMYQGVQPTMNYPQGQPMGQNVYNNHPLSHSNSLQTSQMSDSNIVYAPPLSSLDSIPYEQSQVYYGQRQGHPS